MTMFRRVWLFATVVLLLGCARNGAVRVTASRGPDLLPPANNVERVAKSVPIARPALSQTAAAPLPSNPAPPAPSQSTMPANPPLAGANLFAPTIDANGIPQFGYWIVSSRRCDFSPCRGDGNCCLDYFQRLPDGSLVAADAATFYGSLDPQAPVCFVIHGSYNWWRDVVSESRRITRWIRMAAPERPLQVVFFTWPSDGNMPFIFPVDIAILGRKSSAHAFYLAQVISQLPPNQPVSLVGHSHGARAATAALHLLGGGVTEEGQQLAPAPIAPRRIRGVLIAAAVDKQWLNPGDRYGQALPQTERVLVMRNSSDTALGIYSVRKPMTGAALGRGGLATDDRVELDTLNAKLAELDVAPFIGAGHAWAHYYHRPELAQPLVPYVYFQD